MGRHEKARTRSRRRKGGLLDGLRRLLDARLPSFAPSPKRRHDRRRGRSLRGRRPSPVAILAAALFLACVLYLFVGSAGEGEAVTVVVEEGDTLSGVAGELEEAGVVGSSTLFGLQARLRGGATEIKPGEYSFVPGEGGGEILRKLESGPPTRTFEVAIPEGLTLEQTAERVSGQSAIGAEEFEAAARRTDYGYPFLEGAPSAEGFLFPKKYEFREEADAAGVVGRLLEQYAAETEGLDVEGAGARLGLTEYEVVTVASLVEEEAAAPQERPLVASVVYNRLRAGMPLQIDATVQYALRQAGEPKERLSLGDLEVDSPYNTYKERGLPPGPISSPGLDSIRAALQPARTDYLYYVLRADGEEHFFTDDYEEFLRVKEAAEKGQ